MPGKRCQKDSLDPVKIVALAPMPKANVVTTTNGEAWPFEERP